MSFKHKKKSGILHHIPLRKCSYTFWDIFRIKVIGIFYDNWYTTKKRQTRFVLGRRVCCQKPLIVIKRLPFVVDKNKDNTSKFILFCTESSSQGNKRNPKRYFNLLFLLKFCKQSFTWNAFLSICWCKYSK